MNFNLRNMHPDAMAILTDDSLPHEVMRGLLWMRKADKIYTPEQMRELNNSIQDDSNRFKVKFTNDRRYDKQIAMEQAKQVRETKKADDKPAKTQVNFKPCKRAKKQSAALTAEDIANKRIANVVKLISKAMERR